MKFKLCLTAALLFCMLVLKSNANSRDVYTVWDADELSLTQQHTSFTTAHLDNAAKNINVKKFKRIKVRGLYQHLIFDLKGLEIKSPERIICFERNFYREAAIQNSHYYFSLRGPPAC